MGEPHGSHADPNVRSPRQIEEELAGLSTAIAKAEVKMRTTLRTELDAKLTYEKARLTAAMSKTCPRVGDVAYQTEVGDKIAYIKVTVAYRDEWIDAQIYDEYEEHQSAKLQVDVMKRYQGSLEQRISIEQTQARLVALVYQTVGWTPGGRT